MQYKELLKHPKWQRKRLELLQERKWQCESCHDKETCLHVHHKKYIKGNKPWEYENKDLVVLCEKCHFDTELLKLQDAHGMQVEARLNEWYKTDDFKAAQKSYEDSKKDLASRKLL